MATKLFLRNTTLNGITDTGDGIVYDMVAAAGASADTDVVNTAASGTEIQWTQSAGGSTIAWISGRVPAGGFTLTNTDISVWCSESNMNANCGGRYRVFRYQPGPTITELGGGPFNDGVEFGTSLTEMTWTGNVTDQAFSENDRILVRLYITNVGTMAGGFTCSVQFNAADAATGDSFFNIAETVSFKAEAVQHLLSGSGDGVGVASGGLNLTIPLSGQANGIGVCDGQLTVQIPSVLLSGQADGVGVCSGGLNLTIPLLGNSDGVAIVTGGLNIGVLLSGNIDGIGTCDGQLAVSGPPPPPSEEYYGGILQIPVNQYLGYKKF